MIQIQDTLDQLVRIGILQRLDNSGEMYSFKHALMQDKAYQSLLHSTCRETHRAVAQAYEFLEPARRDEYASLLVHHYAQADDDANTFEYAMRAGDRAMRIYAYAEARTYFAQAMHALASLPDSPEHQRSRIDLLIKLVSVSYANESSKQILERLFQAEALAKNLLGTDQGCVQDRLYLARINYWIGRIYVYDNDTSKAMDYLMRVLADARDCDDQALLAIPSAVIGRMMVVQGQFGAVNVLLKQAIEPLEQAENWAEWISTMGNFAIADAARGEYGEGLNKGERALERASQIKDSIGIAEAYVCLALVYFLGDDMPRMFQTAALAMSAAQKAKSKIYMHPALMEHAVAASRLGEHALAQESVARANALDEQLPAGRAFTDWYAAAQAEIALNAGEVERAITFAEHAVTCAKTLGGIYAQGWAHRVWAQALVKQNAPRAEIMEHVRASLDVFEAGEAMLDVARTWVVWGNLLREWGDPAQAETQFARALDQFEKSGLTDAAESVRKKMMKHSV